VPSFSTTLEQAIHAALALANARRHEFATLEHLLLALIDEPDALKVMKACSVDTEELRQTLVEFVDEDLANLVTEVDGSEAVPTAAFQRVIQRAAIHVQSSGRTEVTSPTASPRTRPMAKAALCLARQIPRKRRKASRKAKRKSQHSTNTA